MKNEISIRISKKSDIKSIAIVSSGCFPQDYIVGENKINDLAIAEKWFAKRLSLKPFSWLFVAVNKNKKVVGFAYFMMIGGLSGIVQLEIMGVDEKYRRQGIASKLISQGEKIITKDFAKQFKKPIVKFILTTSMENQNSHYVYQKQGFIKTASLGELYFGAEEVLYTKNI